MRRLTRIMPVIALLMGLFTVPLGGVMAQEATATPEATAEAPAATSEPEDADDGETEVDDEDIADEDGEAGDEDEEAIEILQLINTDANPENVINQLRALGQITSPGEFVLSQRQLIMLGEATSNPFRPLIPDRVLEDFVISADISFQPAETEEVAFCLFGVRLAEYLQEAQPQFLLAGLNMEPRFVYRNMVEDQTRTAGLDELDLGTTDIEANYLWVVQNGEVSFYLDGIRILFELPAGDTQGLVGMALVSSSEETQCAATDLWIYNLGEAEELETLLATPAVPPTPTLEPCIITTTRGVNRRFGPTTNTRIAGTLGPGDEFIAVRQATGEDGFVWWLLADDTWVRSDVVDETGDCEALLPIERDEDGS